MMTDEGILGRDCLFYLLGLYTGVFGDVGLQHGECSLGLVLNTVCRCSSTPESKVQFFGKQP
jgi:hypothetical protein